MNPSFRLFGCVFRVPGFIPLAGCYSYLPDRLEQKECSYAHQGAVNIAEKGIFPQTMVDNPAKKDGWERDRQRDQVIVGYIRNP